MSCDVTGGFQTEPHTWLTLTAGRVSLAGFRLEVILETTAGCGGTAPSPGGLVWAPPPAPDPWRVMGLWGPLLELEDDLHRMKAISTVGSGLRHKQLFLKSDECSILVAFTVSVKEPTTLRSVQLQFIQKQ